MKTQQKTVENERNADQAAEALRQWIVSREGRQAVEMGLQRAEEMTSHFREAQRVDPDILHKPITL